MRILLLSLMIVLAGCSKSGSGGFTKADVEADRAEPWASVERVDRTESRLKPRIEEVEIPIARIEGTAPAKQVQEPEKIQLLLNEMSIQNPKVSVGKRARLVRFTAVALVDGKPIPVNLEGILKDDSTADLLSVGDGSEEVRAEVFCRGEVESLKSSYSCDSLFVDLYYKLDNQKFYREQLELESEQEKAIKAHEKVTPTSKKPEENSEAIAFDPEKDEGDHGDIPEPLGTYQGRPERVKELFALTKPVVPKPTPTPAKKKNEQPPGKEKASQSQKPSAASMANGSISGRQKKIATPTPAPKSTPAKRAPAKPVSAKPVQPKAQKPAAKPAAKPTPKPVAKPAVKPTPAPVAKPVETPAPAPQKPTPKPQPVATPKPATPKPMPVATPVPATPTATPEPVEAKPDVNDEDVRVTPARVMLDMNDDPNRPVDQAVGGYSGGGKLENSTTMPTSSDYHYFSKPHENQYYGTYDLIRVVKLLAKKISSEIVPGVQIRINDFSKRRGGYIPPHKGHQNGLEADIGYLTENSHEKVPQHAKIGSKWMLKIKEMWQVFKFLGGSDRVSLFYVNKKVKPKFCAYAKAELSSDDKLISERAKMTFRKMDAIGGHTSHFHLRMECGRYNPRCRTDGPPKPNTGC